MCLDSGETFSVVSKISDFDDDITPTIFFEYFNEVPVSTTMSQCFKTIDITPTTNDLLPQTPQEKEIISDPRLFEDVEGRGDKGNRKKREKEWEIKRLR